MRKSDQEGRPKTKRCRSCGKQSPDTGQMLRNVCSACAYHAMQTQLAYNHKLSQLEDLLDKLEDDLRRPQNREITN